MVASGSSLGFLAASLTTSQAFEYMSLTQTDMPKIAQNMFTKFNIPPVTNFDGSEITNDLSEGRRLDTFDTAVGGLTFLSNTFIIMGLLAVLVALLVVLGLAACCCDKTPIFEKWLHVIMWNGFIQFFIVFFLPLFIACRLNFDKDYNQPAKYLDIETWYYEVSKTLGYVMSGVLVMLLIFVAISVTCLNKSFDDQ